MQNDGDLWITNTVFQGAGNNTRAIDLVATGRSPSLYCNSASLPRATHTASSRAPVQGCMQNYERIRAWLPSYPIIPALVCAPLRDVVCTAALRCFRTCCADVAAVCFLGRISLDGAHGLSDLIIELCNLSWQISVSGCSPMHLLHHCLGPAALPGPALSPPGGCGALTFA